MRYIGNIISKLERYRFNRFINLSDTLDSVDKSLPTLVVGVSNAEAMLTEKLDYIERITSDNIFWTFATTEKRSDNERDIENFKKEVLKRLKKTIKYTFFNVLTCSRRKFRGFLRFLQDDTPKSFYFTEKTLYIAYGERVLGISLDDCEYVGVKKKKIYSLIKKRFTNVTTENSFLTEEEKIFFEDNNIIIAAMFCYANT